MMGAILIAVGSAADDADDANVESVQLQFRGDGPLGSVTAIADSRAAGARHGAASRGRARARATARRTSPARSGSARSTSCGIAPLALALYRHGAARLGRNRRRPHALPDRERADAFGHGARRFLRPAHGGRRRLRLSRAGAAGRDGRRPRTGRGERRFAAETGSLLEEDVTADGLIDRLLIGLGSRDRHAMNPIFFCPCSRERALRTLSLLERQRSSS